MKESFVILLNFRQTHSTTHPLIYLTELTRKQLDDGNYSCNIFAEFQEAFETVDRGILLKKPEYCGIRGISN